MTLTICEITGKPIYETTQDVNHPIDYTFESVNDFVHCKDASYEELQYCCLGMATEIEKINTLLNAALVAINDDSKRRILEKRGIPIDTA